MILGTSAFGQSARRFNDPFLLPSSSVMPTDHQSVMDFALFLYYMNPAYAKAAERTSSYFVTDFKFDSKKGGVKERGDWLTYMKDELGMLEFLLTAGNEHACFAGETKVTTREGVFPIRELTGRRVEVLSKGGVFRPADFKSYGVQRLMEVEFSDGQRMAATPEHQWEIRNMSGAERVVTTRDLLPGHRIARTVAPRPPKNADYLDGVRNGFVFGDGSARRTRSIARFFGDKDAAMLPFFEGVGCAPVPDKHRDGCVVVHGLPKWMSEMPRADASPSFWYGFVSGFLAADGHCFRRDGSVILAQVDRSVLEAIYDQLPRIGMAAGKIHSQVRDTEILGRAYEDHELHLLTLLKRFMRPEDFLIPEHRLNFERNFDPACNYGKLIAVKAVRETERVEEVFCCVEMVTHTMVVGNAILTKQCYGNSFPWIYFPFDRVLVDLRGGRQIEWNLAQFGDLAQFNLGRMKYSVPDPREVERPMHKRARVELPFVDRIVRDPSRIRLRLLDPRYVTLIPSTMAGTARVCYRFPPDFLRNVKQGVLHEVNFTPRSMLEAVRADQDYLFNERAVFHMKGPTISGISNSGWGLPGPIANYRSLFQMQVLRKIDEAVALDYMLPLRMITPGATGGQAGADVEMLAPIWTSFVGQMIERRRSDPFALHSLPFPVQLQETDVAGRVLAPKDSLMFQKNEVNEAAGYPIELWNGSMNVQAMPISLRLFENHFFHIFRNFSRITRWVNGEVSRFLDREQLDVSLKTPSTADDLDARSIIVQMAASGEVSRTRAFQFLNIEDPVEEVRRRLEEDMEIERAKAEMQARLEKEFSQGTLGAPSGAGATPADGGSGAGISPQDIMAKADQYAQQVVQSDAGTQQRLYDYLRGSDPQLHALVKEKAERLRRQTGSQAVQQLTQGQQAA